MVTRPGGRAKVSAFSGHQACSTCYAETGARAPWREGADAALERISRPRRGRSPALTPRREEADARGAGEHRPAETWPPTPGAGASWPAAIGIGPRQIAKVTRSGGRLISGSRGHPRAEPAAPISADPRRAQLGVKKSMRAALERISRPRRGRRYPTRATRRQEGDAGRAGTHLSTETWPPILGARSSA